MKHPNRSGRGKHFTKGKYANIVKSIDEQSKCIKARRSAKTRVKILKYDGITYKIRYRKATSLAGN